MQKPDSLLRNFKFKEETLQIILLALDTVFRQNLWKL